jgi:preprotein translocase subunit YajC
VHLGAASFDRDGRPDGGTPAPDSKEKTMQTILAMAAPPAEGGGAPALFQFLPIILIFLVFWFMIIRPQKKQQDQRKTMLEAIKRGDRIVTAGGLFATVRDVKGDRVVATIAENVKVEISKAAITGVLTEE